MRVLRYTLVLVLPVALVPGLLLRGLWPLLSFGVAFGLIPLVDAFAGHDTANLEGEPRGRRHPGYDLLLWLWLPIQGALIAASFFVLTHLSSSWIEILALGAGLGLICSAVGITIAHELMHRSQWPERAAAEVLMLSVTYPHFCIEHVHGHHRHVATPLDPATARLGESLYAFLPRTLFGSIASAWRIEAERTRRRGIAPWSLRDRRTRYLLEVAIIYGCVAWFFGLPGLALFGVHSLTAIVVLEAINYVEHYGLRRRETKPGRFERVQPWHSWNASHRLTNWLLFNLQRHSDHHYLASRPYYELRHHEDAPQLPAGYAAMVPLAFVPPLWLWVMDRRVETALSRLGSDSLG